MRAARDIDLLRLEMDTLWGVDLYGRPRRSPPLVALAVADDGQDARFADALPTEVRRTLEELLDDKSPEGSGFLEECRRRLGARVGGGPSYVFPPEAIPLPVPTSLRLLTSEREGGSDCIQARPDPWWEPEEWADLVAGKLGPWAIAMAGDRVVSLCHTPVALSQAAEAGVWTHPDARGRGLAPIVTAAWAEIAAPRFETLFYSTAFDNAASQAVARKLGLRPIGEIFSAVSTDR